MGTSWLARFPDFWRFLASHLRPRNAPVPAFVKTLIIHGTRRGDRIYAVFQTLDGVEVGVWAPADLPELRRLREGDRVQLRRNRGGCPTIKA